MGFPRDFLPEIEGLAGSCGTPACLEECLESSLIEAGAVRGLNRLEVLLVPCLLG